MLPATLNKVLGSGTIYFDPLNAASNELEGERYLAETPGFSMAVATEKLDDFSSDGPVAALNFSVTKQVTRAFKVNSKNVDGATLAMFLMATLANQSTTTGALTDQVVNGGNGVTQGRWYQLGVSSGQPTGMRDISLVTIKVGATSKTVDVDYTLNAALGRIYIIPGGGISDADVVTADFTKSAATWEEIKSDQLGARKGALRFIADNTAGENRDLYIPLCEIAPDGEFAFKSREAVQDMAFSINVRDPGDGRAQVYINGRPA